MSRLQLKVLFSHSEKDLKYFEASLAEFRQHVLTLGYTVEECWTTEFSALSDTEVPAVETEAEALAVETSTAVDTEDDVVPAPGKTVKEVKAAIKALKAGIGGNKILSQGEMAEALGVSRYMIRRALK